MNAVETALVENKFLEGLSPGFIENLAACARMVDFSSGQFILRQGAAASKFFLIRNGKVTIELFSGEGGPVVIRTLGAGDVVGWSWLIPPFQWRFDARAMEPTRAIELDADILKTAFREFPVFGYAILERFIRVIADRLEGERMELVNLYAAHS